MNNNNKIIKYDIPATVAAIAVNNFLKLTHVLANLNNLNNLSVLNA